MVEKDLTEVRGLSENRTGRVSHLPKSKFSCAGDFRTAHSTPESQMLSMKCHPQSDGAAVD